MSDTPEPLSAILDEMRDARNAVSDMTLVPTKWLTQWADRIEAAAKQEAIDAELKWTRIGYDERKAEEKRAPGNAAAMRDALNRVGHLANDLRNITERDTEVRADVNEIVDVCRAALATPARNCDVGTAEEQAHRFHAFCSDNTSEIEGMCNSTCPCIDCGDKCHCLCVWGQMPFAPAEGGKE